DVVRVVYVLPEPGAVDRIVIRRLLILGKVAERVQREPGRLVIAVLHAQVVGLVPSRGAPRWRLVGILGGRKEEVPFQGVRVHAGVNLVVLSKGAGGRRMILVVRVGVVEGRPVGALSDVEREVEEALVSRVLPFRRRLG